MSRPVAPTRLRAARELEVGGSGIVASRGFKSKLEGAACVESPERLKMSPSCAPSDSSSKLPSATELERPVVRVLSDADCWSPVEPRSLRESPSLTMESSARAVGSMEMSRRKAIRAGSVDTSTTQSKAYAPRGSSPWLAVAVASPVSSSLAATMRASTRKRQSAERLVMRPATAPNCSLVSTRRDTNQEVPLRSVSSNESRRSTIRAAASAPRPSSAASARTSARTMSKRATPCVPA